MIRSTRLADIFRRTSDIGDVQDNVFFLRGSEPECPADFNGDGDINATDFFAFLDAFFDDLPSADLNRDGEINAADFFAFVETFFNGCD